MKRPVICVYEESGLPDNEFKKNFHMFPLKETDIADILNEHFFY